MELSADAARNRRSWDRNSQEYQARHSADLQRRALAWGVWRIPESRLRILGDVIGKDILEFGCGAAQFSIALARMGARLTGLDNSEQQLIHARDLMKRAKLDFPLVHASAEAVPLPDRSFDIVFCDHGAMSWADPHRTVPEVARLLRRGGLFAFAMTAPLLELCYVEDEDRVGDQLVRDYFHLHRLPERGGGVSYQLPYGEWIRLFRRNGLVVDDLVELRPTAAARTTYADYVPLDWARRWPAEHIWRTHRE